MAGGRRLAAVEAASSWSLGPLALRPSPAAPTPPHAPVPPPVPRETGKLPRGNSAKTQTEGATRRAGKAATAPTPVSPKRFCKQRDKWQGPWIVHSHPKKAPRRATNTCRHQKKQGPSGWCTAAAVLETGPPQPPPPPPVHEDYGPSPRRRRPTYERM